MSDRVYIIIDDTGKARYTAMTREKAQNTMLSIVPDARDHNWSIASVNKKHLNKASKACQQWLSANILNIERLEKIPSGEHLIAHMIKVSKVEEPIERMMERIDDWVDGLPSDTDEK